MTRVFPNNIPTLLAGGNIDIIETDDKYGWLLTKYEPVFDSLDGRYHDNEKEVKDLVYYEYYELGFDGETWESGEAADNELIVTRDGFEGWDHWRKLNREGVDVAISFEREGSRVVSLTENAGISIKNITTVKDKNAKINVALSGDQCAITNIRIVHH